MAEKEKSEKPKADKVSNSGSESEEDTQMDLIRQFFAQKLSLGASHIGEPKEKVVEDLTVDGLISHWNSKGFKNIITLVGAGISTSAGIPDFRSPGTGLYDNLQKFNLPFPMAIFDIGFFQTNPKPFFMLAKELYPGNFKPTPSHYFVRLLHEKGLLQRHYTQNIDTLERAAGIPEDKLVEAHGTFFTNHCIKCRAPYTKEWVKEYVFNDKVPMCTKCKGVVKPDIVFFGEDLPQLFYTRPTVDFAKCDLLIVMGTSLEVYPFASLLEYAGPNTVRLIINRTKIVDMEDNNTRDIEYLGDCDEAVWKLCDGLGWTEELKTLIKTEHAKIDKDSVAILTSVDQKSVEKKTLDKKHEKSKEKLETVVKETEATTSKTN